jgi:sugar-specific transcriptional regulator TrmB
MKELGFTIYESKVYVSLLKNNPATCYEISKNSGVPRSAIYEVVNRLEVMGVVNATYSKPKKYVPLTPDKLSQLLESQFKNNLGSFRENIEKLSVPIQIGHLWNIKGYENMIQRAKEMIESAQKFIYLSVWNRELLQLEDELKKAEKRGVKVVIFSFTALPFSTGRTFSYQLSETELEKIWDHKIILCIDLEEILMGDAEHEQHTNIAWTRNKAIVNIGSNHIVLDLTIFGQRFGVNIDDCVIEMKPGEFEHLGKLLSEKYPK